MPATRRLLSALAEAGDALAALPKEHGRACTCIICHEHSGLEFMLRLVREAVLAAASPADWPAKRRAV